MLQDLLESKSKVDNHDKLVLIHRRFDHIPNRAEKISPSMNKQEFVKILNIVNSILAFNEENQSVQGLKKIITPNQMLCRLPISLARLKAGNNSEKLKNEIRQLLYSLYRSKYLQKISIKIWLIIFKNGNNLYEH